MRTQSVILLIAFMAIGGYCNAQDLKPKVDATGQYGCIDKAGKEVFPCKYDAAHEFSDGLAIVKYRRDVLHRVTYTCVSFIDIEKDKYDSLEFDSYVYRTTDELSEIKDYNRTGRRIR